MEEGTTTAVTITADCSASWWAACFDFSNTHLYNAKMGSMVCSARSAIRLVE